MKYRIRNWNKHQHYKDRNPPWIKLHFELLTSRDWVTLDDASRVLAVASMLIASRSEVPGEFEADPDYFSRVAYLNSPPDFKPLINSGFLEPVSDASNVLASARPETETETEEECRVALDYLNEKSGRKFRPTERNLRFVSARLNEGLSIEQLKQVVNTKVAQWGNDERMADYLRPETLFGPKCESYLQAAKPTPVREYL